jgi:uncharacterized protein
MFYVKTDLGKSLIHGIGLFSKRDIKKGERVYKSNPNLDLILSDLQFGRLEDKEKERIAHYGYFNKRTKKWHLAHDDIRFCNHSSGGNLTQVENRLIAKRDIKKGEELTQDYSEFEELREELKP